MAQMANVSDITIGDKSTREYVSSRGEINTFSIPVIATNTHYHQQKYLNVLHSFYQSPKVSI